MSDFGQPLQEVAQTKIETGHPTSKYNDDKGAVGKRGYLGRGGLLKSRSFGAVSSSANRNGGSQGSHQLQRSRKRTRK